jgi:hypothetical protein
MPVLGKDRKFVHCSFFNQRSSLDMTLVNTKKRNTPIRRNHPLCKYDDYYFEVN